VVGNYHYNQIFTTVFLAKSKKDSRLARYLGKAVALQKYYYQEDLK